MSNPEAINETSQDSQSQPEAASPPAEVQPVQATDQPTQEAAAPRPAFGASSAPRPGFVSREERDRRRREALANLKVGEWREGKVTGIAQFGAFVDLGGVDGLVHVSQLGTGGYVERVEDVVQVGQVVRVRVAEVESDRGRVSLSMREPRASTAPGGGPPRTDRPAAPAGGPPRPARPAAPGGAPGGGGFGQQTWSEPAPEGRHDRRGPRGNDRFAAPRGEDRQPRRAERTRRGRDADEEDWRQVRGDPRGYFSFGDEPDEEPAPTTAEELVARFGKRGSNR